MSTSTPDYFVQLPFTTDQQALEDDAVDRMRAASPGWEPNDGDPEVVTVEAIGPMAANAVAVASTMSKAALIQYGVKLLGIPFQPGSPATTTVTFTLQDNTGGYGIDAGMELEIDGYAFKVAADLTSVAGLDTVTGSVVAVENSADYNNLTGITVSPISLPPYVVAMTVNAATENGIDPQDEDSYASDLSAELQLTTRGIITLPNIETTATEIPGIARAHAITDASRDVEVWLLGSDALAVPTALKDQLAAIYQANRLINVTFALLDPTFNAINVVWVATMYNGFDQDDYIARVNAALAAELDPLGWGVPKAGDPGNLTTQWYNNVIVKADRLKTVISQVDGTYEVDSVNINGGGANNGFIMSGTVALPTPGTMTGTVTVIG